MLLCLYAYSPVHTTVALEASNGYEKHDDQTWNNKEEDVDCQEGVAHRSILQVKKGVVEPTEE